MKCRDFAGAVERYLDETLSPADGEALRHHAAGCPACAAQIEALACAERALRSVAPHPAPPGMLDAVYARVRPQDRPARRFRWGWPAAALVPAAAAAAFLLLLGRGVSPPVGERSLHARVPALPGVSVPLPETTLSPPPIHSSKTAGKQGPHKTVLKPQPVSPPAPVAPRHPLRPRPRRPASNAEARSAAAAVPEENLSPALLAALQRPVTVVFRQEPLRAVARQLVEAADVPVHVEAPPEARVSLQARDAPLWFALEKMAEQTGAVIEPAGNGVALRVTAPRMAQAPPPVERPLPAQPQVAGQRQMTSVGSQKLSGRSEVWSPRFGSLPEKEFEAKPSPDGDRLILNRSRTPAAPEGASAEESSARKGREPLHDSEFTGSGAGGMSPAPLPDGLRGAAAPAAPSGNVGAAGPPGPRGQAALTPERRELPGAASGEQVPKAFETPRAGEGVRARIGWLVLIRVGPDWFGALQPLRITDGVLRYRLWIKRGDGRLDGAGASVRTAESRSGPQGGSIPLPGTSRRLRWAPGGESEIDLFPTGPVVTAPTELRGVHGLDAAASQWIYCQ
ncbi:MAG: zf-HC2 domain-containing protein [Armatimonadetes bacterium]|nr:zf-HC2 domain-containing protein [Armatimonadota bacterium]